MCLPVCTAPPEDQFIYLVSKVTAVCPRFVWFSTKTYRVFDLFKFDLLRIRPSRVIDIYNNSCTTAGDSIRTP